MLKQLILTGLLGLTLASPALSQGLDVKIEGIRNAKGKVLIFVFDNRRAFENLNVWKAVDFAQVSAQKGTVHHEFKNMTKGPYAIFLFHDENDDQDLNATNTQLLEGLGATGAPNPEDDPDFAAASAWPGNVQVHMHYDM